MFWPCKFQESINPRKSKFAPFFFLFKIIPAVFVMVTVFICVIVPSLFIFPQPAFANEVSKFHHSDFVFVDVIFNDNHSRTSIGAINNRIWLKQPFGFNEGIPELSSSFIKIFFHSSMLAKEMSNESTEERADNSKNKSEDDFKIHDYISILLGYVLGCIVFCIGFQ